MKFLLSTNIVFTIRLLHNMEQLLLVYVLQYSVRLLMLTNVIRRHRLLGNWTFEHTTSDYLVLENAYKFSSSSTELHFYMSKLHTPAQLGKPKKNFSSFKLFTFYLNFSNHQQHVVQNM